MELTMTNSFGFCELNEQEMMLLNGGVDGWGVLGSCCLAVAAAGLTVICPEAAPVTGSMMLHAANWMYESLHS